MDQNGKEVKIKLAGKINVHPQLMWYFEVLSNPYISPQSSILRLE